MMLFIRDLSKSSEMEVYRVEKGIYIIQIYIYIRKS